MAKIRNGFVSNSSSSSFILPVSGDITDKFAITITLNDLKRMLSFGESGIGALISNKQELDSYIVDQYGWRDQPLEQVLESEYVKEKYDELLAIINSGISVLVGDIDYNDSTMENFIKNAGGKVEN